MKPLALCGLLLVAWPATSVAVLTRTVVEDLPCRAQVRWTQAEPITYPETDTYSGTNWRVTITVQTTGAPTTNIGYGYTHVSAVCDPEDLEVTHASSPFMEIPPAGQTRTKEETVRHPSSDALEHVDYIVWDWARPVVGGSTFTFRGRHRGPFIFDVPGVRPIGILSLSLAIIGYSAFLLSRRRSSASAM